MPLAFIVFASAAVIFLASLQLYQTAFTDLPSNVAIQQQFNDLGNALSTELTGAILALPHRGVMEFEETIPQEIGGHNYKLDLNASSEELQLYSFKGFHYNYTLSGMSAEVNTSVNTTTAYGGISEVKITLRR
ncbi:MAG: hypothetical protein ACXQTW_08700 [Candidatus Methanospirareceae archaeon]